MIQTSRRGFLAGLLGTSVIAVLPIPAQQLFAAGVTPLDDPFAQILPPDGTTYQWITSAVMGQPCPENIEGFLSRGWKFVLPAAHPGAPTASAENAIATCGLILVEKPTIEQEKTRQAERAYNREVTRAIGIAPGMRVMRGGKILSQGEVVLAPAEVERYGKG